MILSTISVGFQASNFDVAEEDKTEVLNNIHDRIPEEVKVLGVSLDKYVDDINFIVVLTITSVYESGITLKLVRDSYKDKIKSAIVSELSELMNSKGIIYQQLSVD